MNDEDNMRSKKVLALKKNWEFKVFFWQLAK